MTKGASFRERRSGPLPRLLVLLALGLVGSTVATSCLTPEATFSDSGDGDNATAGGASGDGDGDGDGDGVPVDHCSNRRVDADETDTDCGGRDCEPCELGRACSAGADCINGTCTEGVCQMPTCTDRVKNMGETDVDCGGDGCPPCGDGSVCEMNADCESLSCKSGTCAEPTCDDRIQNGNESDVDCGGNCDPCESGGGCTVTDDCVQPPDEDPSTTVCEDGVCTLLCGTGLGDCNQLAGNGCETNLNTDATHCGACGDTCSPDNAVGECLGGTCLIKRDEPNGGCIGNWLDCNSMDDDGCEANVNNDVDHCGACDAACSDANGTPSCSGGSCSISCDDGFDDCDTNSRDNGCEVDTDSNATFCGGCEPANDCPDGTSTQSPFCDMGMCGLTDCPAGFGDCDGDNTCTDDLSLVANCGGCGTICAVANGTPNCTNPGAGYECGILSCASGGGAAWNDCDDQLTDAKSIRTATSSAAAVVYRATPTQAAARTARTSSLTVRST